MMKKYYKNKDNKNQLLIVIIMKMIQKNKRIIDNILINKIYIMDNNFNNVKNKD